MPPSELDADLGEGLPCRLCFHLDCEKLQAEYTRIRRSAIGLERYKESSKTCTVCGILFRATNHFFPEVAEVASLYEVYLALVDGRSYQFPHDVIILSLKPRTSRDTTNDPVENVVDGWKNRLIQLYSVVDKLTAQVKTWMSQCEENHPNCRTSGRGLLPKRLVQILPGSRPGNCKVRLCESSPSRKAPYVCLSHCWGKHQIIVTTRDNLQLHQNEIRWNDLSTTFQQAIDFSCRLGIEFIWIDSLCIIQDSTLDWEQEAVMMAAYYSNAELTLAATSSEDGTGGLFRKRSKDEQTMEITGHDTWGRPYHLNARIRMDHPFDRKVDEIERFPLMQRGWVYQEHILSKRFLHFGPRELVWECHSQTLCECGTIYREPPSQYATNQVLNVSQYDSILLRDTKKRRQLWYETVENVMDTAFTRITDRLVASAGLVTVLAKGYRGRYLAGLWEDCLIADLCWCVFEGMRPDELKGVPSWSWGSVTGEFLALWCQLDIVDPDTRLEARVVKVDCQPDPPSFTGSLTCGKLVIEGKLLVGELKPSKSERAARSLVMIREGEEQEYFQNGFSFHADDQRLSDVTQTLKVHLLKMNRNFEIV
ncbi:hypothetical protein jhhlp_008783 [Lomentospora prolificans]|uniref:Heterokaryon incompatibility domain-containing protein n=1 Tax=Lomentospora prolificans TaxID=41688 RepID=A0A2N3MZ01_9PEZI|nr:hypothetical protein jhhlp_008783 [Lomentospora prolificans]